LTPDGVFHHSRQSCADLLEETRMGEFGRLSSKRVRLGAKLGHEFLQRTALHTEREEKTILSNET
jgi:hypothetical protein